MKESYGEGIANYTSLESCGNCSNAVAEALTKEERPVKEKFRTAGRNDSRKSDNNIVPEKPANKESKNSAEQVEGRALTEGNTMNTAAVRTQGRAAASNGL